MTESFQFFLGLIIRFGFVIAVMPWTHEAWFLPFLTSVPEAGTPDLWSKFLEMGGNTDAFPYGMVYVLVFAPLTIAGDAMAGHYGAHVGLGLTVILLEAAMLTALQSLSPDRLKKYLLPLYWLSPIPIYVGYWHGHLDILPTLLLTLSLVCLKTGRRDASAAFLGLAIASKMSMVIAAPFVFIYMFGSPRERDGLVRYAAILIGVLALTFAPQLTFPGFREMALGTPELQKGIALAINYGGGLTLYILPMAVAALLFIAWRIRRFSFEGLVTFIALAFLMLYLLTPAAPGWAMWFSAFVALHTARSGLRAGILYGLLCVSFVALHLMISTGARSALGPPWDLTRLVVPEGLVPIGEAPGWVFSSFAVAAALVAIQMFRERILESNFHRYTRRPLLIGIAGDSGTGKDTLSDLISEMFSQRAACRVSGDDYHIWDRHKPMWRALTHLNPNANDLDRFVADVVKLQEGRPIRAPHYDHAIGRMTKPLDIHPNELIIVSGLHAIYSPVLNARYDLKIFLDMHEGLRRYLKVRRDVTVRGHAKEDVLRSISTRSHDSEAYIQPQKAAADIVISLEPAREADILDFERAVEDVVLRVRVTARRDAATVPLENLLVAMAGLHVHSAATADGRVEMMIEGAPTADQVKAVASILSPQMTEHLARHSIWHGAQHGLLQLIILSQIDGVRAARGGIA